MAENDTVRMTSPHGTVVLPLKLEDSMQPGYLFAPIHFSEPNFNALMSAVPIDPKARMPALKVVPVKVQKREMKRVEPGSIKKSKSSVIYQRIPVLQRLASRAPQFPKL